MKETDKAYIAGFVDGEGCISISFKSGYHHVRLVIVQKSKSVLEKIQKLFGFGSLRLRTNNGINKGWIYTLEFSYNHAFQVIKTIYPYLCVKRKQAEVFFKFYKTILPHGYTKNGLSKRAFNKRVLLKNKMHFLNSKKELPCKIELKSSKS